MKKYIILAGILGMGAGLQAQDVPHEILVYGSGGLSSLNYSVAGGKNTISLNGGGGVGFTYFFSNHIGITTGAEVAFLGATVETGAATHSSPQTYTRPGWSDEYYNIIDVMGAYKETQSATYFTIPLLAQYQTTGENRFYAAAGAKFGFTMGGSYDAEIKDLTLSGDMSEIGLTFTDYFERGWGTQEKVVHSGDLSFGFNIALSVEAGYRLKLTDYIGLYAGAYADYGLSNIAPDRKKTAAGLVNNRPDTGDFTYNSLLVARQQNGTPYVDKVNTLSAGIKLKLAFQPF